MATALIAIILIVIAATVVVVVFDEIARSKGDWQPRNR